MIYTINCASYDSNYLAHHGIKGMKWGVRRYQNPDGSLTAAGRKRYGKPKLTDARAAYSRVGDMSDKELRDTLNRLDNEKRLKEYAVNLSKRKKAERYLKSALGVTATITTVYNTVNQPWFKKAINIVSSFHVSDMKDVAEWLASDVGYDYLSSL